MPTILDPGKWELLGANGPILACRVARTYRLAEMGPSGDEGSLRIDVTVESNENVTGIRSGIRIVLKPLPIHESRTFVMPLITSGNKGSLVEVLAIPNDWDDDAKGEVTVCIHDDDVPKCLRAISYGDDLTFALAENPVDGGSNIRPPFEAQIKLVLPNDAGFKSLYNEAVENVVRGQEATWARHLRELWFRKRDWELEGSEE